MENENIIKYCPKCKRTKPIKDFCKNKSTKSGFCCYCKKCSYGFYTAWRLSPSGKSHIKKNKKKYYQSEHGKRHQQNYHLKTKYGLSLEQYKQMCINQNHCCLICGIHSSKLNRILHVDHSHKTGKVRGLLCNNCNLKLPWFENNKEQLLKYLT